MNDAFTKTHLPALVPGETGKLRRASRAQAPRDHGFEAQVLGQAGQRRGLKGGQPVLDAARAAYLEAEWRGVDDRRLPVGALRTVRL